MPKITKAILTLCGMLPLLGACRADPAAPPGATQPSGGGDPQGSAPPTEFVIPTPYTEAFLTRTPTPEPIRFVFPSPGAPPQSAWRPPLYPVPWAPTEHDHFFFIRPIAADEVNWPDGSYRYGGIFFEDVIHSGVDIRAGEGAPVMAAGAGKVIWAGYGLYSGVEAPGDPYGLAVAIRHDFGYDGKTLYTLYGHLSRVDVIRGQHVETGEKIGEVGQTGFATGPHLHFEVRLGKNDFFTTYNPELWIAPPQGWGVLAGRIMGSGGQLLLHQEITITSLDTGQVWETVTYGDTVSVNSDAYYRENFVVGDLPAGRYAVATPYLGRMNQIEFEIFAGQVTYLVYLGREGFLFGAPPALIPTALPTETPVP
jgi:murein DD-endopeptidase MepM/ murein hydrolase activator NlpD